MDPVVLHLPFPPSVNNLFANGAKGRFPTPRYKAWREEAALRLHAQRPRPIKGRYVVTMRFERPDRRARDADNLSKAPMDLLVSTGVIEADHLSKRVILEREAARDPG